MTVPEALTLVAVAVLGAGGPVALWISTRSTRRAVGAVEASTDRATGIYTRLGSIETSLRMLADSTTNVTSRLDGHDREIHGHGRRIDALEAWRHAFHLDDDDRLNPPGGHEAVS